MSVIPVPGFGFLRPESHKYIEEKFQMYVDENDISTENFTVEVTDMLKCNLVVIPEWKHIFPDLATYKKEEVCSPFWDNASCIPAARAGFTATLPCMQSYNGQTFSPLFNASRECGDDGSWNEITYYGDCLCNSTGQCETDDIGSMGSEISVIIYLIGYVLSFLALCGALTIYLSFR